MSKERADALKQALQMEIDGKVFYEKARDNASDTLTKGIFSSLIKAEEAHMRKIQQLHTALEKEGSWPKEDVTQDSHKAIPNIFSEALSTVNDQMKGTTDDIEALKLAAQMEEKGRKYYQYQAKASADPFEKKFYLAMVQEESEHFVSIMDTLQYLEDPQAYFHQFEQKF